MNFIDISVAFELKKSCAMEVFIICNGITLQKLEYIAKVVTTLPFKLSSTQMLWKMATLRINKNMF